MPSLVRAGRAMRAAAADRVRGTSRAARRFAEAAAQRGLGTAAAGAGMISAGTAVLVDRLEQAAGRLGTAVASDAVSVADSDSDRTPGSSPDTGTGTRIRSRRYAGTVADLVSEGLLQGGDRLEIRAAGVTVEAWVAAPGLLLVYGAEFASPSGAAGYALGRSANGWTGFRTTSGPNAGKTLHQLRLELPANTGHE